MTPWPRLAPWGRYVPTGNLRPGTFVFDSGPTRTDAPPVILIHGLGDEADTSRASSPCSRAAAVSSHSTFPGFGRSAPSGRTNLAGCARAVRDILREISAGPAVLVGSSVGAVIAQLAAFRDPAGVRALVCIDGGLPPARSTPGVMMPMILPFSGERIYTAYRADHDAAFASLNGYYSDLGALPQADRDFLRKRVIDRVESDAQRRAYFSLLRSLVLWSAFRPAGSACGRRYSRSRSCSPGEQMTGSFRARRWT